MGGPDVLAKMLNEAFEEETASDFVYTYGAGKGQLRQPAGLFQCPCLQSRRLPVAEPVLGAPRQPTGLRRNESEHRLRRP